MGPHPKRITLVTRPHGKQGLGSWGFSAVNSSIPLYLAPSPPGGAYVRTLGTDLFMTSTSLCAASGYATGLSLLRSCSGPCSEAAIYCNRTATGIVQASTQRTKVVFRIAENPINKRISRTH